MTAFSFNIIVRYGHIVSILQSIYSLYAYKDHVGAYKLNIISVTCLGFKMRPCLLVFASSAWSKQGLSLFSSAVLL